jgi:hypothetical protein
MKRFFIIVSILCLTVFFSDFSDADIKIYEKDGNKVTLSGEVTGNFEYYNFFEPTGAYENEYSYGYLKTKIGLEYDSKYINIFLQGQNTNILGLPEKAIAPAPQSILGFGAAYYARGGQEDYSSTFLKQGYLKLKLQPFTIKAGRFNFEDGEEVLYKDDPKISWLKRQRISGRFLGQVPDSAFERSFDGGVVAYDSQKLNLNLALMRPTQGVFENDAMKQMDDIDVGYMALTLKKGVIPYSDARLFYVYYNDGREATTKVDNLPTAKASLRKGDIKINTIGFHLASAYKPVKGQEADLLLWGAIQSGDWGQLDHKAWAFNAELGYQFLEVPLKPWFRIGYFVSSGDSDPNDNEHGTFFMLLPSARKQGVTPGFYNHMNLKDLFAMVILKPTAKSTVRIDGKILKLNESNDRWYAGTGADREDVFGYLGRPSQGSDDLGKLLGLRFGYDFNKYLSGFAYYSHVWGGDVIEKTFPKGSDMDFFQLQVALKF